MSGVELRRPAGGPIGLSSDARALIGLGALTLLGLGLRIATIGQSLYGDETFTYRIVTTENPAGILQTLQDSAITPPLHYMLAWICVQLGGEPTVMVRLPSLLFGTAAVPLVYLLGTRTVGRAGALVGAAVMALSPFAIFYSTEARNYGVLMFLVALSTLLLLRALDTARRAWWAAYVLTAAAVLYCHYTGGFVLLAQGAWALLAWPAQRRAVLVAYVGIGLLYLPWLPSFLNQSSTKGVDVVAFFNPLTTRNVFLGAAKVVPGHPFVGLGVLPGTVALAFLAGAAAAVLAGIAMRRDAVRRWRPPPRVALVVLLMFATPLGALAYSKLRDTSIYAPRNLISSLPAACLALGALATCVRGRVRVIAVALLLGAVAIGAARSLDPSFRRPPIDKAADFIDDHAGPGDVAVQVNIFGLPVSYPLLRAYVDSGVPVVEAVGDRPGDWRPLRGKRRIYAVAAQVTGYPGPPRPPDPGPGFRLERTVSWDGFADASVFVYRPVGGD